MKKNNLSLKDTFLMALDSYKKKDFLAAENLCNKILSIDSDHFDSIVLLSNMLAMNGNFVKAKDLLIKADLIQPDNLVILNNLGTAFKEMGEIQKGISYYERVIKIKPDHINAQYNLALSFYQLKKYNEAKKFLLNTVNLQPNFALAFINLANVYVELKDYENAVSNYQKGIKVNPNLPSAHNNLGLVFRILNDYENAIKCYKKAIEIRANYGSAHHNLAMALKEKGDFIEATKEHEEAIKHEPDNLVNYFYLSELKKDILNENLKSKIDKIMKKDNLSKRNLAYGHYILSRYERHSKHYDQEVNNLIKAHRYFFESKKDKFDLGVKYCFEDVPQISLGAKVKKTKTKNENEIKPIFIVGVPRCGSTLVEKIIGSGTEFVPMGEETAVLENFINSKILQKKSLDLGNSDLIRNELINIYKNKNLIFKKYNYRFTDKSLNNFFYLELIKDIFPGSKIINCKRNFLSSIMSILQNNITELAWAHDLNNIFKYFDNYFETIENFQKIYPECVYQLEFEKLVNDPENESKKLMKFCELKWDKKCLEFYKRKDLISKTASNIQIRNAVYKHSVDRYLPYKKILTEYGSEYSWFK